MIARLKAWLRWKFTPCNEGGGWHDIRHEFGHTGSQARWCVRCPFEDR